jgi:hypothetical protein
VAALRAVTEIRNGADQSRRFNRGHEKATQFGLIFCRVGFHAGCPPWTKSEIFETNQNPGGH